MITSAATIKKNTMVGSQRSDKSPPPVSNRYHRLTFIQRPASAFIAILPADPAQQNEPT